MKKYQPFFIVMLLCMVAALANENVNSFQEWIVIAACGMPFAIMFQIMANQKP